GVGGRQTAAGASASRVASRRSPNPETASRLRQPGQARIWTPRPGRACSSPVARSAPAALTRLPPWTGVLDLGTTVTEGDRGELGAGASRPRLRATWWVWPARAEALLRCLPAGPGPVTLPW